MPQPADPRAADKFVALDHEPAVLRAVYREAAGLDQTIRTGSRCRYCPPNQPA